MVQGMFSCPIFIFSIKHGIICPKIETNIHSDGQIDRLTDRRDGKIDGWMDG